MTEQNIEWVNKNLARQRKMLEDKNEQKRAQTASSIRTNSGLSGISSNSYKPDYKSLTDADFGFAVDPDEMTSTVIDVPNPSTRKYVQSVTSSTPVKCAATPPTRKSMEYDANELVDRLNKSEISLSQVSDDEGSRIDKPTKGDSTPWNTQGIETYQLPVDAQPDISLITKNPAKFVEDPAQKDVLYKCTITRDKKGMDKGIYPTYYLHLEYLDENEKKKIFLLAARRRKKSTTANYLISNDPTNLGRDGASYVAKVRSNALGTHFTIYDRGMNPKKAASRLAHRAELAAVIYETNVLGFKGPRKMTIIVPKVNIENSTMTSIRPEHERDSLQERFKNKRTEDTTVLSNKNPVWNEDTQSYVLNFHGRVTQASVKNFQIIIEEDPEYIVMQFGRVSEELFTMDFRFPLSAIQAFGIAMTSFHGKLACE